MPATPLRRQSRELALQVLFQMEHQGLKDLKSSISVFRQGYSAPDEVWSYALTLLEGIEQHRTEIDQAISQNSAHWRIERMPSVDAHILRVATYELLFGEDEVPEAAAINEAIEIAKKFSTSDSGKFINGVLDQIRKSRT